MCVAVMLGAAVLTTLIFLDTYSINVSDMLPVKFATYVISCQALKNLLVAATVYSCSCTNTAQLQCFSFLTNA